MVSGASGQVGSLHAGTSALQHPLSSIAERRSGSGEDSEDEGEGGWQSADVRTKPRNSTDEGVIKSGYLWKKGERRKVIVIFDTCNNMTDVSRPGRNDGLCCVRHIWLTTRVLRNMSSFDCLIFLRCTLASQSR